MFKKVASCLVCFDFGKNRETLQFKQNVYKLNQWIPFWPLCMNWLWIVSAEPFSPKQVNKIVNHPTSSQSITAHEDKYLR